MSEETHAEHARRSMPALAIGALGVVFGDIATSPLYALQEAFGQHGVAPTAANVLGVLSIVFWSLIGVVSLKYVLLIMRADNHGEGGIMALLALATAGLRDQPRLRRAAVWVGLTGAALFLGDSVITPAISVLSAVEGLKTVAPGLQPWVLPVSVGILLGLFSLQKFGTERVARLFGPIMLAWLLAVAILGLIHLLRNPDVLTALDPRHGLAFFQRNGLGGFATLGATVLVLTGAEALYADMGHFGLKPIRAAWLGIAMPCLLASYFGQGALLLADPAAAAGPFYRMVPAWALLPIIALATAATVIASQAVITGAYSMVREAVQLGYLPRTRVWHTSGLVRGQVYLPAVSGLLLVVVLAVTIGFGSASALAAAFGIAVSGTMLTTTLLVLVVARTRWSWSWWRIVPLGIVLVAVDVAFVGANLLKLGSGGWFPLVLGAMGLMVMLTWRHGRDRLTANLRATGAALAPVIAALRAHPPLRVPGNAVFLTRDARIAPQALLHNLKHNQVLHERNVLLEVHALDTPRAAQRVWVEDLGDGFHRVDACFGFAETPDVPQALDACAVRGLHFDPMRTTYFTSRETLDASRSRGIALWRDRLFAFLSRNAMPATGFYRIPDNQRIDIGRTVTLGTLKPAPDTTTELP